MNGNFFMPDISDDKARIKWNEFNKQINGENFVDYKIPIEAVRYRINGKIAIDRIGELSSNNSKKVIAIVESNETLTVFTDDNGLIKQHIIDKNKDPAINQFNE